MNTFRTPSPPWVRTLAALAAGVHLVIGFWAVTAPSNWFQRFPGFGEALVAAEPPFNAHLASDAGAGFLAVGAVLALAAIVGDRLVMLTAAVCLFAFSAPHFAFHATHPSELLSTATNITNVITLAVAVILPIALFAAVRPTRGD